MTGGGFLIPKWANPELVTSLELFPPEN